ALIGGAARRTVRVVLTVATLERGASLRKHLGAAAKGLGGNPEGSQSIHLPGFQPDVAEEAAVAAQAASATEGRGWRFGDAGVHDPSLLVLSSGRRSA